MRSQHRPPARRESIGSEIRGITIGVPPAGCAVLAYNYFDVDMLEAMHGRGCAVATGIKRVLPDKVVFSYQGDGDLAAIGTAETIHAANRGENIPVIFINNAVYGMTGGQMAPTTILGQRTTTSPPGRNHLLDGTRSRSANFSHIWTGRTTSSGMQYIPRRASSRPEGRLKKGSSTRWRERGFSLIEILSQCPTNWKMTPIESCKWVEEVMAGATYPLGVIKDVGTRNRSMLLKAIFAGFGGQGVLMMGYSLSPCGHE